MKRLSSLAAIACGCVTCLVVAPSAISAKEVMPAPWLQWSFDSSHPYGHVEQDLSGSRRDGLMRWARIRMGGGARYLPGEGICGGAARVDDRGSIESKTAIALPAQWTITFWVKPTVVKRVDNIFSLRAGEDNVLAIAFTDNADASLSITPPGGQGGAIKLVNPGLQVDKWALVAVSFSQGKLHFQVNDASQTKQLQARPWTGDVPLKVSLGGLRGHAHHKFEGALDELRVFDAVLDPQTLSSMATSGAGFFAERLSRPTVDAGAGYTVRLDESGKAVVELTGKVSGAPAGQVAWSVVAGPAGAQPVIEAPNAVSTQCTLDRAGEYRIRLTGSNATGANYAEAALVVFAYRAPIAKGNYYQRPPHALLPGLQVEPERLERKQAVNGPIRPVAYWTFDREPSGEASAGKLRYSDSAASIVDTGGRFAGALQVDGLVDFGKQRTLEGEWSLSFWLKSSRDDKRAELFKVGAVSLLNVQSNKGGLREGESLVHNGRASHPLALYDTWHHIVITSGRGMGKLYVDGHLVGSDKTLGIDVDAREPLQFSSDGPNYQFRGLLDEVALYDVVLNNEEVAVLGENPASTLTTRIAADPFMTRSYRQAFVDTHFPELELSTDSALGRGFDAAAFPDRAPSRYVHPRIFFTLEELGEIRGNLRGTVGRTRMAELRQYVDTALPGLLDETGEIKLTAHIAEGKEGKQTWKIDTASDATLCAEAFRCLIDADTAGAQRLIRWLERTAELQSTYIKTQPATADWQEVGHNLMLRLATPLIYDYLAPWMSDRQQAKVSGVIAAATQGRWSLGMYALPAMNAHLSNHETWVTGEYLLALMSIEGENGFDPEAYREAMRALRLTSMLLADPDSGATYEGMAKNLITAPVLAAASRRTPLTEKMIAGDMPYNHVRQFFFHTSVPWGGWMMMDDLLGGLAPLRVNPPTILKAAYPADPMIDYVYHSAVGGRDDYGRVYFNTYGFAPEMMAWSFIHDWDGPDDLQQHLAEAVAAVDEPLGYFSNYRGLMISRSDWSAEALQLYFQPRCAIGGHAMATRGYFRINALGREWAPFYGWYNDASEFHSVVLVDGVGQDFSPATVLAYDGAAASPNAAADTMTGDLTAPYRQGGGTVMTPNENRLQPNTKWAWMNLPRKDLVHWHYGDRPQSLGHLTGEPKQAFDYAVRSAGLVRGPHPYVIISDAMQKDTASHEYRWSMALPKDIWQADLIDIQEDHVVLSDPDGERKLLVQILHCEGEPRFEVTVRKGGKKKTDEVPKLDLITNAVTANFKVLIQPFRDEAELPRLRTSETSALLQWQDTSDEVRFDSSESKRSRFTVLRDGKVLALAATPGSPDQPIVSETESADSPQPATPDERGWWRRMLDKLKSISQ